jgi:hypothetical protein
MTVNENTTTTPLDAERADLLAALAAARAALTTTVRDLTDDQAASRPTVSALCPGGVIKHVAAVEEGWVRFVVDGPKAMSFDLPDGVTWADIRAGTAAPPEWMVAHQEGFQMGPGETLAGILERYQAVAARTEEIIAEVPDLSVSHPLPAAPWNRPGTTWSARRVLMHIIAETTQHAGHADILRESIDGRTSTGA